MNKRSRCPESQKICFTEREAKDELAAIIVRAMQGDRKRRNHRETAIYECERCGSWHLTSRPWSGQVVKGVA